MAARFLAALIPASWRRETMLVPQLNEGRQLERRLDWCEPGVVAGSPAQRVLRPHGRLGHSPELRMGTTDTARGVLAGLPEYPQSQASDAPLPLFLKLIPVVRCRKLTAPARVDGRRRTVRRAAVLEACLRHDRPRSALARAEDTPAPSLWKRAERPVAVRRPQRLLLPSDTMFRISILRSASRSPTVGRKSL
jgi:hypothetical protein